MEDAEEAIEHWKIEVFEYNVKSKLKVTSLLFVKARFYTHLLDPSKKNVCLGRSLYNTLFRGIGNLR